MFDQVGQLKFIVQILIQVLDHSKVAKVNKTLKLHCETFLRFIDIDGNTIFFIYAKKIDFTKKCLYIPMYYPKFFFPSNVRTFSKFPPRNIPHIVCTFYVYNSQEGICPNCLLQYCHAQCCPRISRSSNLIFEVVILQLNIFLLRSF